MINAGEEENIYRVRLITIKKTSNHLRLLVY
jgi:hypothetical protein